VPTMITWADGTCNIRNTLYDLNSGGVRGTTTSSKVLIPKLDVKFLWGVGDGGGECQNLIT